MKTPLKIFLALVIVIIAVTLFVAFNMQAERQQVNLKFIATTDQFSSSKGPRIAYALNLLDQTHISLLNMTPDQWNTPAWRKGMKDNIKAVSIEMVTMADLPCPERVQQACNYMELARDRSQDTYKDITTMMDEGDQEASLKVILDIEATMGLIHSISKYLP
jgi:hypothetical protein